MNVSVLPNVIAMEYSYESLGLTDILELITTKLKASKVTKVASVAFLLHTSEKVRVERSFTGILLWISIGNVVCGKEFEDC